MFDKLLENVSQQVGTYLPGILTALAVLVIGWIIAHLIARVVRVALKKTGLGTKLNNLVAADGSIDVARMIAKAIYYMIMIFVLITFFSVLDLPVVSEPLNAFLGKIFEFAPRILSAGILSVIAYVLARVLRDVSRKGLEAADIDSRIAALGKDASALASTANAAVQEAVQAPIESAPSVVDGVEGAELDFSMDDDGFGGGAQAVAPVQSSVTSDDDSVSLSQTLPEAVYWVVFALFLPAILGALQMPGLLEPVQAMFTKAFNYLPNIIGAAVILLVGTFIAKIVRQVVSNLTASLGVNKLAAKAGLGDAMSGSKISDILGVVVYALILLPIGVAALNTLDIAAVTEPASAVLNKITSLFPGFLGGGIVLAIAFFVGKIVSGLAEEVLSGIGFDAVPEKIGLKLANTNPEATPSKLGGKLVLVAIVLLSTLQALPMMGLESFAGHLETFAGFATQVLMGLAIVAVGLYLANLTANLVKDSGIEHASKLAMVARIAILIFAGGFGLQQMGLSASIVNVAFGSILGGLGLAAAIAFGWGGRDAAKRIVDRVVK